MSLRARYPGICGHCGEHFPEGADIRSTEDDGWVHAPTCPEPEPDPDLTPGRNEQRCPDCFLTHAGECY